MKSLIVLGLSMVLFIACKDNTPPRYTSASAEIDVVKALVADYSAGNWDSWMSHYADTAKVYHNSTEPIAPKDLQATFTENLKATPVYGFQDKDQFFEMVIDDKGEKWVNFWGNWEGTIAENNKKLVIPVHVTAQFVDGKIVEEHAFYNMEPLASELNALAAAKMAEETTE